MKSILIVGFGVSDETGYVDQLQRLFAEQEVLIHRRAIGGADLWSIPYLSNVLCYGNYDLVLFEVSTCLRYSKENPESYASAVREMVAQVRRENRLVAFVHLFRGDIDYRVDNLNSSIDKVCNELDVPVLNLVGEISALKAKGELSLYLRDGTHTSELGAIFYANKIRSFVGQLLSAPSKRNKKRFNRKKGSQNTLPSNLVERRFFPVDCLFSPDGTFSRGGVELPFVSINEGASLKVLLPEGYVMDGVLFIRGPKVGVFEVELEGRQYFKILAYDKFCYYRRYSIWKNPGASSRAFNISQTNILPNLELIKGESYSGPRVGEIAGFLATRVN